MASDMLSTFLRSEMKEARSCFVGGRKASRSSDQSRRILSVVERAAHMRAMVTCTGLSTSTTFAGGDNRRASCFETQIHEMTPTMRRASEPGHTSCATRNSMPGWRFMRVQTDERKKPYSTAKGSCPLCMSPITWLSVLHPAQLVASVPTLPLELLAGKPTAILMRSGLTCFQVPSSAACPSAPGTAPLPQPGQNTVASMTTACPGVPSINVHRNTCTLPY